MADLPLSELTVEHVESIYAGLADRGVSAETILSVHRTGRSYFGEAVKRGLIARNPVLVARPYRAPGVDIQPLSLEEVRAVLVAAAGQRNAGRWQVALVLGLRQSEALGLQWAGSPPSDWATCRRRSPGRFRHQGPRPGARTLRQRAIIHVGGPEGAGKTTFIEQVLARVDPPLLVARGRRDDRLDEPDETSARTEPELRRYLDAGAGGVAPVHLPGGRE